MKKIVLFSWVIVCGVLANLGAAEVENVKVSAVTPQEHFAASLQANADYFKLWKLFRKVGPALKLHDECPADVYKTCKDVIELAKRLNKKKPDPLLDDLIAWCAAKKDESGYVPGKRLAIGLGVAATAAFLWYQYARSQAESPRRNQLVPTGGGSLGSGAPISRPGGNKPKPLAKPKPIEKPEEPIVMPTKSEVAPEAVDAAMKHLKKSQQELAVQLKREIPGGMTGSITFLCPVITSSVVEPLVIEYPGPSEAPPAGLTGQDLKKWEDRQEANWEADRLKCNYCLDDEPAVAIRFAGCNKCYTCGSCASSGMIVPTTLCSHGNQISNQELGSAVCATTEDRCEFLSDTRFKTEQLSAYYKRFKADLKKKYGSKYRKFLAAQTKGVLTRDQAAAFITERSSAYNIIARGALLNRGLDEVDYLGDAARFARVPTVALLCDMGRAFGQIMPDFSSLTEVLTRDAKTYLEKILKQIQTIAVSGDDPVTIEALLRSLEKSKISLPFLDAHGDEIRHYIDDYLKATEPAGGGFLAAFSSMREVAPFVSFMNSHQAAFKADIDVLLEGLRTQPPGGE